MMQSTNPELRYRKLWLIIGYLLIILVIFLSLMSSPVDIDTDLPYQDKLFHAIAYFSTTFWFLQIYHIRHHVVQWVFFFLCLGLLLEYLQGFDSNRHSDIGDMVANALGVAAALVLSRTRLRFMLMGFERYFVRNAG
ncbi:MAG: VanZ family protein [Gammaproteobacteria bacterium]